MTRLLLATVAALVAGGASADDLDIESWSKTFGMLGFAAGQYDACTHRDALPLFADLAGRMTAGRNDDAVIILEDAARIAYFAALAMPCDASRVDVARDDMNNWARTIRKAAARG